MNKKSLLLLMITLLIAFEASADETVILLTDYSARGEKIRTDTVVADGETLMVNSEKLTPAQIIAEAGHIKKISEFKISSPIKTCEAGRFEHILKKGKLVKKESGCLESERYLQLKASFKALAKDPVLN